LWLKKSNKIAFVCLFFLRLVYPLIRLYSGVELAPSVDIGPGLWIGHFGPTVFHPQCKIGQNLSILHSSTIGSGTGGVPILADNISVGAGAIVIGGIRIGNNVIIGAGAVVTKDVPDNSVVIGGSAKPFPRRMHPKE
jgi:serine O-acetyltransferase